MIADVLSWLTDPLNWSGTAGIPTRLLEHLAYSVGSLLIAALIGIPLGFYIGHTGRGTFVVAGVANALRALPTLGLLFVVVMLLTPSLAAAFQGSDLPDIVPSIIVLVVLAVPPILSSTYAGVAGVDLAARDAAYGMGMTGGEVLVKVEAPCALPLILSGIRSAMLQVISTATIAAFVSLGGLGRYLIDGQATRQYDQMLGGAILVAGLAIVMEAVLAGVQRLVVSKGLSGRYNVEARRPPDEAAAAAAAAPSELVGSR